MDRPLEMELLINKEREQIKSGDLKPKTKFTYIHALLKSQRTKKRKEIDYTRMSTSRLLESIKYNKSLIEELKRRPFFEIIEYFESIPPLKNKLYYWHPSRKINDPLTLITKMYKQSDLLNKIRKQKCQSLIFNCTGFDHFEKMLGERMNMGDIKVLNEDYRFFEKYWMTKKGKLQEFNDYIGKFGVEISNSRKTVEVIQRIITHPYWCDDICGSKVSFLKLPSIKNLDFVVVECFSFMEIEINEKAIVVSFKEFYGLISKNRAYESLWNKLGVSYNEEIEIC